jgi:hypothetical protein
LSGIEVVEQDRRFIKLARKEVEEKAHRMLEQGMEAQVQLHSVGCCLQQYCVFFASAEPNPGCHSLASFPQPE